ncbi:MAG: hypothetical protein Fues2KO_40540 [Fuerstiella sp.]
MPERATIGVAAGYPLPRTLTNRKRHPRGLAPESDYHSSADSAVAIDGIETTALHLPAILTDMAPGAIRQPMFGWRGG